MFRRSTPHGHITVVTSIHLSIFSWHFCFEIVFYSLNHNMHNPATKHLLLKVVLIRYFLQAIIKQI